MPIVTLSLASATLADAMKARVSVAKRRWARRMERSEAGEKREHSTARRKNVKHKPLLPGRGEEALKAPFRKAAGAQFVFGPPAGRGRRSAMNRSNSSRSLARRIASEYSANSR